MPPRPVIRGRAGNARAFAEEKQEKRGKGKEKENEKEAKKEKRRKAGGEGGIIDRPEETIARAMLRTRIRFLPANAGSVTVVTPFLLVGFFPHVVRSGVPLHRGKLQLKLSLIVLIYPKKKKS